MWAFSARVWSKLRPWLKDQVVEEGFYLGSRQRAGMAFVMEIDKLADPVYL
jgi:hypothetical protein